MRSVAGPDWSASGAATLIKTSDGGITWSSQLLPSQSWMDGLDCKDSNTCWTAGRLGAILVTTNGGSTWKSAVNVSSWNRYLIAAKWTGAGDTVLIGSTAGRILRATDGLNFTAQDTGSGSDQWDFACPVADTCFSASGGDSVLLTTDNGATWTRQVLSADSTAYLGVTCTDANTCWAAGTNGRIMFTSNRGGTWQRQQSDIPCPGQVQPDSHVGRAARLRGRLRELRLLQRHLPRGRLGLPHHERYRLGRAPIVLRQRADGSLHLQHGRRLRHRVGRHAVALRREGAAADGDTPADRHANGYGYVDRDADGD